MSWTQLAVIPVLSLLLLVHELGHFIVARMVGIRVEEFGFGLPPRLFGFKRGGVIYSLNLIPLGAFVRMTGENGEDAQVEGSFNSKGKLARAAVLVAGPFMNFVTAALLFAAAFMIGWPTPTAWQIDVYRVSPDSPAAAAGLQPGDRIMSLDGKPVDNPSQFVDATRQRLGQPLAVTVDRNGTELQKTMVPRTEWPEGDGPLGIGLQSKATAQTSVSYPAWEAIPKGFGRAMDFVGLTFAVPISVIQGALPASAARPTGPIGIFQITTQAADQIADSGWWFPLIEITALVGVGLAVANLLPIPALDGGRLLMIAIEAIRRKRIAPEREATLHFVGLMVLLTLMVLISYYDLSSPLPQIDWGPR